MRKRAVVRRVTAVSVVVLLGVVGLLGCSSVEPNDVWADTTGTLTGRVQSDEGDAVGGIDVWLTDESGEYSYTTETDTSGDYSFDAVPMTANHSFTSEYELCVNRDPEDNQRVNQSYGTYRGSVTIERGEVSTYDVVIAYIEDDPGDPHTYIDD